MALETYRKKRDFKATREPAGSDEDHGKAEEGGQAYLIQKHAARRLHYDLRLQMGGVLKSWAVTRGPSLVPGEKRLAVHVEDHPLEYGDFEGTIPKGQYGGGTVALWDRGTWAPVGDPQKGYAKGHLDFDLHGEKLKGRWHLVRMAPRRGERGDNWLLIKSEDRYARAEGDPDILDEAPRSVKTGRSVEQIAKEVDGAVWNSKEGDAAAARKRRSAGRTTSKAASSGARKPAAGSTGRAKATAKTAGDAIGDATPPAFLPPQLATLKARPPAGDRWLHEIKFDGYRLQARVHDGKVSLLTRSGIDWTERFGDGVASALAALPVRSALIDGELVVENAHGASDFSALQADLSAGRTDRFVFYAFDLMFCDGEDLTGEPLRVRKARLEALLKEADARRLRYSAPFDTEGAIVLKHACRLSLEGVVSKRRDAPYRSGRSAAWVKSKCANRQEFVIGGYVLSTSEKAAIGSLVLGAYRDGKLIHVGRVGTGFSRNVARALKRDLGAIAIEKSPFAGRLTAAERKDVVFVRPDRVAEIEFRAWTGDGHLRHAAFRSLREDKEAHDVVIEEDAKGTALSADANAGPAASEAGSRPRGSVRLTHPDRLYWPDAGVTKAGLADYYADVWPMMAPFVAGRPLSLLRGPGGIDGQCFFQKHAWKGISRTIRLFPDPKDPDGEPLLVIDDLDGAIALVQSGTLEIHPWGSTISALETPDLITLDLDPGDGVGWDAMVDAARAVRARLEADGLAAFLKTSGGKGLHVVAPLSPSADWTAVKAYTERLARAMAADEPDRYVATVTKSKRKGRILVDYLRNGRGATAVAPYSPRARTGAPVSMPIAWEDLSLPIGPATYTVVNAVSHIAERAADPWADFRTAAAALPISSGRAKGRRSGK